MLHVISNLVLVSLGIIDANIRRNLQISRRLSLSQEIIWRPSRLQLILCETRGHFAKMICLSNSAFSLEKKGLQLSHPGSFLIRDLNVIGSFFHTKENWTAVWIESRDLSDVFKLKKWMVWASDVIIVHWSKDKQQKDLRINREKCRWDNIEDLWVLTLSLWRYHEHKHSIRTEAD